MIKKKGKSCGIKYKYCEYCLEYTNVYVVTRTTKKSLMKTQKSDFIIDANVLTMILINLICFYKHEYMDNWENI